MAYNAGTAFLQIVPSFAGVVTSIAENATEWGTVAGQAFKESFEAQVQNLNIGVDVANAAAVEGELGALTADRDVTIKPTIGAAASATYLAELAALLGLSAGIAGAAGAGGGAAGGGGGLLGMLGWGGGIAGFAAFGSVLSLMGFGMEHLIVTTLGLAASLAGALVGGALLAAGALSILGVGMVTDLGGIGQAAGDTKTTYTALSTYQTASQALAKQIPQTAAAQTALNTALSGFAPAAQQAVLAAALTASQFHWMYDQVTGVAEAIGANIINQALQVGEKFLPILGQFATINMGIIQSGLQPLFQFLGTTGVTVFTELEDIFTARLPTAMSALNQGVQLLVNSIAYLAGQTTGGFMTWLNNLLTYLNTPTGFDELIGVFSSLISMAKDWWGLLKQVAITLYDLFKPSAGLGTSIVTTLTSMLKSLDAYLTSVTGSAALHSVFEVHKTEVIELLGFLGTLISVGGQMMLVVIPPFVTLANTLLGIANLILHTPILGTIVAWGVAAVVLWKAMKLAALYSAAVGAGSALKGAASAVGLGTVAEGAAGGVSLIFPLAAAAVIGTLIGEAIAPAILKFLHLAAPKPPTPTVTPPGSLRPGQPADPSSLSTVPGTSPWAGVPGSPATLAPTLPSQGYGPPDNYQVWIAWAQRITSDIGGWFKSIPGDIWSWIQTIPGDFGKIWSDVSADAMNWVTKTLEPDIKGIPGDIKGWLSDAGTWLLGIGGDILKGLWNGIKNTEKWLQDQIGGLAGNVIGWAKSALGISSPSTVFAEMGRNISLGLAQGIQSGSPLAASAAADLASRVGASFGVRTGNMNVTGANNSVLAALQRIENAVQQVGPTTAAGVSTKVNALLGNTINQHARATLQAARNG